MQKVKHKLSQAWAWAKDHKKTSISAAVVILLTPLIVFLVLGIRNRANIERIDVANSGTDAEQAIQLVDSPTTGKEVTKDIADRPVVGVMISNSTGARPQSGLNKADLVFEAIAEGGITRYFALFHDNKAETIGPVRSLRPYFIDWARTFDAAVAHVGGSPQALSLAKTELKNKDIDEFRYGRSVFERISSRPAPHNTYTSFDKLLRATKDLGNKTNDINPFPRTDGEPAEKKNATRIRIPYSTSSYNTEWRYNIENNSYQRFLAGQKHVDAASGNQVEFDVVIVLKSQYSSNRTPSVTYSVIDTVGTGEAYIFQNGTVIDGTWTKKSKTGQYTFKNNSGQEVAINRGSIWFAVQPTDENLSYE